MAKNPRFRSARDLRRYAPKRPPYDRILIVCEGEKTERNYFDEIRQRFRISAAHIHVIPSESGTDPKSVVNSAEEEFNRKGKSFERVYAVFDRDDHINYANAIHMACARDKKLRNDEKQPIAFEAIVSVPCFELWLLLHFSDVRSPMHRDALFKQLKTHIPDYEKGMPNLFEQTECNLTMATDRAKMLKKTFQRIPGNDPYTDVHELVEVLMALRSLRPSGPS
jgi:RloB-like protein